MSRAKITGPVAGEVPEPFPCDLGRAEPPPDELTQIVFPEFEELFRAERTATRLGTFVVLEVRDEGDAPGIEAAFVVCPEGLTDQVARGREIVFRPGDDPEGVALRAANIQKANRDALRFVNRALRRIDERRDKAVYDLLRVTRDALEGPH